MGISTATLSLSLSPFLYLRLCLSPSPPLSLWRGSRPICGLARGLLFVNVSISCVLRNVELFNLNFPRCAEAPLSLGPAALPCPWHKAITQTQSHTGHAGAAAVRIAPQGNGKNIAPGRQNKSYNESLRQSLLLTPAVPARGAAAAYLQENILKHRIQIAFFVFVFVNECNPSFVLLILSIKVAPIRPICDDAHVLIYNARVNPECDEFIKRSSLNLEPPQGNLK